jgi:quercetin dioxygenase-like cupin family protein
MSVPIAALALAAVQQASQPATVPMRDEPYHHPVFENPQVAVYNVVLPVGAVMRYHEHPTNHLAIVIESGRMRNEVTGRPAKLNPTGGPGTIVYLPAGPPHRQTNIGQTTVRFIAVELLTPPRSPEGQPPSMVAEDQRAGPDPRTGCRVAMEAADVRAWRCRLEPGDSVPGRPRDGPFLRIAVSGGRLEQAQPPGQPRVEDLRPGASLWYPAPESGTPKNASATVLEFVDLEWK